MKVENWFPRYGHGLTNGTQRKEKRLSIVCKSLIYSLVCEIRKRKPSTIYCVGSLVRLKERIRWTWRVLADIRFTTPICSYTKQKYAIGHSTGHAIFIDVVRWSSVRRYLQVFLRANRARDRDFSKVCLQILFADRRLVCKCGYVEIRRITRREMFVSKQERVLNVILIGRNIYLRKSSE